MINVLISYIKNCKILAEKIACRKCGERLIVPKIINAFAISCFFLLISNYISN
jgi:hypothetical protein